MRKFLLLLTAGLFLGPAGATTLDATIQQSCPSNYEPLISMDAPGTTYSHPANPGFYSYDLCVRGIEEAKVASSCEMNSGFYMSENATGNAHFSIYSSYKVPVCTGKIVTQVRDSCFSNQTALMSVSGKTNAHVARAGVFDKQVCGFFAAPENITVSMEFNLTSTDEVYFDNQKAQTMEYRLAEYPYMVSEGGGFTAGIVAPGMIRTERQLGPRNTLIMERNKGSFFLPFIRGSHQEIEDEQEAVLEDRFLNRLDPSFSYPVQEQPEVKTVYMSNVTVESALELSPGTYSLEITKTGPKTVRIGRE